MNNQQTNEYIRKEANLLGHTLIVLILACFLGSLLISLALEDGEWVQRSGSLVVLFSVILEIRQTLMKEPQKAKNVFMSDQPALVYQPVSQTNIFFHWFAWTGIAVGTIVWGYGDLIFNCIFR